MKRIGCLTFHGAHNYGSCLQAYALQEAVQEIGDLDYQIINYRTATQKRKYQPIFERKDIKSIYMHFLFFRNRKDIKHKWVKFEQFISKEMNLTKEIDDKEVIRQCSQFDTILVGSDQIWNLRAEDFSWVYFLPFELPQTKKVAYAASIGIKKIVCNKEEKKKIGSALQQFDLVSVRDSFAYEFASEYANNQNISVVCDPTLLVSRDRWKKLASSSDIAIPFDSYILFYDLSRNKENWIIAHKISKTLKLPVVITSLPFPRVAHYSVLRDFKKYFNVGPKEWLRLMEYAKLILTSSFHGTVFSILFQKEFFTLNAMNDYRVSHLLKVFSLQQRNLTLHNWKTMLEERKDIDYSSVFAILKEEIERSKEFLRQACS